MLKPSPPLTHVALIALITLAISGCNKERSYPVYRENPAPKDALPIVIRVHDAPVELTLPKVFVSYEIDPLCLPPINNYEGVQYAPPTALSRVPSTTRQCNRVQQHRVRGRHGSR